jgi:hypothetical protein
LIVASPPREGSSAVVSAKVWFPLLVVGIIARSLFGA